ncbi:MAG: glycosyltransferase [Burkholderiales bacterium]|jgi:glycosyltransferase involved in cell wall biosynthesis
MKLAFVITGLSTGGAERMLLKLVTGLRSDIDPDVVSLGGRGDLAGAFESVGVPVLALGMRGAIDVPRAISRLAAHFRRVRPDVVSTWLYHADLVGGLAARAAGFGAIAWNIRNGSLSRRTTSRATRAVVRLNGRLSGALPETILCCSEAARDYHVALGFDAARFQLIPNGFDLSEFRPDVQARVSVRSELGFDPDAPVIGLVARWDPQKDHRSAIDAAGRLLALRPDARFVLAGPGVDDANETLRRWIGATGAAHAFRLLGGRTDVARLTAAFDVATLTSIYGEAFPNVLGEAMACGVPCVATDVGDAACIVGDTGRVVPPADGRALAAAWASLLSMSAPERSALGTLARRRVLERYDLGAVRRRYEGAFEALTKSGR